MNDRPAQTFSVKMRRVEQMTPRKDEDFSKGGHDMSPQEQMRYNLLQGQFYVSIFGKNLDEWVLKNYSTFVKIAKMYRQFPIRITFHVEIMRKIVKSM
jgi:hypothetical protein